VQKQWEISREYGMFATPIGYPIDEQGIIARDVAVGIEPILALAAESTHWTVECQPSANGKEAAWTT
jgi:hypothetical protein